MDRPLIIGNVHNLSLESYSSKQTRLVALFAYDSEVTSCVYTMLGLDGENVTACPALGLYNRYHVTFTGINVTVQSPKVSGLVIKNVSNITLQMVSIHNAIYYPTPMGVIILRSSKIRLHSLKAYRFQYGIAILNTNNISIHKLSALENENNGILLSSSNHSVITHSMISHNKGVGMNITNATSINISNVIVEHNQKNGLFLGNMSQTHISNTNVLDNWEDGMVLEHMIDTQITNCTILGNGGNGLSLRVMNNTHIIDTTTTNEKSTKVQTLGGIWRMVYIRIFGLKTPCMHMY